MAESFFKGCVGAGGPRELPQMNGFRRPCECKAALLLRPRDSFVVLIFIGPDGTENAAGKIGLATIAV